MSMLEVALGVLGTVHAIRRSGQLKLDGWHPLALTLALSTATEAAWHTPPPTGVGVVAWVVAHALAVTLIASGLLHLAETARPRDRGDGPRLRPPTHAPPPPPPEYGHSLHRTRTRAL